MLSASYSQHVLFRKQLAQLIINPPVDPFIILLRELLLNHEEVKKEILLLFDPCQDAALLTYSKRSCLLNLKRKLNKKKILSQVNALFEQFHAFLKVHSKESQCHTFWHALQGLMDAHKVYFQAVLLILNKRKQCNFALHNLPWRFYDLPYSMQSFSLSGILDIGASQILTVDVQAKLPQSKPNLYGSHIVREYGGVHFKYHSCRKHCFPGVEFMFSALYRLISNNEYGVAPSEIVKVFKPGFQQVLIASQSVNGKNFEDWLKDNLSRDPGLINHLTSRNFSSMFMMSLLSRPKDATPQNYSIAAENCSDSLTFNTVGFDHENTFLNLNPITRLHKGKQRGHHVVELKSIFFLLPQMNNTIDPIIKTHLLNETAEHIVFKWLDLIYQQNQVYADLLKTAILDAAEYKNLKLPISFVPGTISLLYKQIKGIQHYLLNHPLATHRQLLSRIYPGVSEYYQKIQKLHEADTQAIIKSFDTIFVEKYTIEELFTHDEIRRSGLVNLIKSSAKKNAPLNRTQTLTEAYEEAFSVSRRNHPNL